MLMLGLILMVEWSVTWLNLVEGNDVEGVRVLDRISAVGLGESLKPHKAVFEGDSEAAPTHFSSQSQQPLVSGILQLRSAVLEGDKCDVPATFYSSLQQRSEVANMTDKLQRSEVFGVDKDASKAGFSHKLQQHLNSATQDAFSTNSAAASCENSDFQAVLATQKGADIGAKHADIFSEINMFQHNFGAAETLEKMQPVAATSSLVAGDTFEATNHSSGATNEGFNCIFSKDSNYTSQQGHDQHFYWKKSAFYFVEWILYLGT